MNGQPSGSSPISPHTHSQLSCNSPTQCQHQDRSAEGPCLTCLQRTSRICKILHPQQPLFDAGHCNQQFCCCTTKSLLATPSNVSCNVRLCANVHVKLGLSDKRRPASGADLHKCAALLVLNSATHLTAPTTAEIVPDCRTSPASLTCAAPPVQHHEMCTVIPASIASASKHIRSCIHCNSIQTH